MSSFEDKVWVAVSEESFTGSNFEELLDVAKQEITQFESAGIFEKGPVWTEIWYRFELSRPNPNNEQIEIPASSAGELVEYAHNNPQAFEMVVEIATQYLENERPLPYQLRRFLIQILQGRIVKPKRLGKPPKNEVWKRNFMVHHVARLLESREGIKPTRNAHATKDAASEIIVHAIKSGFGTDLDLGSVQNILTDKRLQNQFEELRFLFHSSILDELP